MDKLFRGQCFVNTISSLKILLLSISLTSSNMDIVRRTVPMSVLVTFSLVE